MLADLGCTHVIVGHSERRHDHGETSALVARKAQAAQQAGLTPIVCLGETQAERDAGRTLDVLSEQLTGSLADVDPARLVLAYEPVWAIGTGRTATADDVETAHAHLRAELTGRLGNSVGGPVRLLYGGSVKPANAGELLAVPDVDGALVGGASLKSADFLGIAAAATPMS
jgi:triosephosphate isomerase